MLKFYDSPARYDFNNLQFVAGLQLARGKFRGRDGLAIMLDDDAARLKILGEQKLLDGTRDICRDGFAIGDDGSWFHGERLSMSSGSASPSHKASAI